MLSVTLVVAVETLSLTLGLGPRESQVLRCVEMTGITLLLAIRSHWVNDRGAFNLVSLGTLMPAAWLASRLLCGIYRIAPLATVSLAVPSYSAWRYAPDQGQSGALWPIRTSLRRGAFVLMASTAALLVLPGCSQKKEASPAPTASGYDLKGVIVTVDAPHHSLVVHHEDIPGYMPSMTMDFPVPDADLSSFKEGQQIAARMVIDPKGDLHLEGVRVLDPLKSGIVAASEASLQQ
jgi:Cu/Ag efflux protein CusF